MAELVLSRRDSSTGKRRVMTKEMVETILAKLSPMKIKKIFLHGDWTKPPEYSEWLFQELKNQSVKTTICIDSEEALSEITTILDRGTTIELCLNRNKRKGQHNKTNKIAVGSFFFVVDIISRDGSHYSDAIDSLPSKSMVTLGINWQSRLSGPAQIEEEDYQAWSDTVMALVEMLSAKKITTTFACGTKLCMFSREQLGTLPTRRMRWPLSHCDRSYFFDVDGHLQPCMRLTLPESLDFNHESDMEKVSMAFLEWLTPYCSHCLEAEDLNCRSLKVGCCSSGCIAHTVNEWQSF